MGVKCPRNVCFRSIQWPNLVGAFATPGLSNTDKCGICFKVACRPGPLRGTPASSLSKQSVCRDAAKRIEIMITDSCPAQGGQQPGNRIWC